MSPVRRWRTGKGTALLVLALAVGGWPAAAQAPDGATGGVAPREVVTPEMLNLTVDEFWHLCLANRATVPSSTPPTSPRMAALAENATTATMPEDPGRVCLMPLHPSMMGLTNVTFERVYLERMIQLKRGLLTADQLAMERAAQPDLVAFANRSARVEQQEIDLMTQMLSRWHNVTPAPLPTTGTGAALQPGFDNLGNLTGGTLEQAYIGMRLELNDALRTMSRLATGMAAHPEVRDLAGLIVESTSAETERLEAWRDGAGGGTPLDGNATAPPSDNATSNVTEPPPEEAGEDPPATRTPAPGVLALLIATVLVASRWRRRRD